MTRPLLVRSARPARLTAVRFRPGGATPFLRFPAHEITDSQTPLMDNWRCNALTESIGRARHDSQRVRALESGLWARISRAVPDPDRRVRSAVTMVHRRVVAVGMIAANVGLSRQHLTRLFRREVGIGPKQFARVVRMQRLRTLLRMAATLGWTAVALEAGYYDQPHMIHECHALTGLSPRELAPRQEVPFLQDAVPLECQNWTR